LSHLVMQPSRPEHTRAAPRHDPPRHSDLRRLLLSTPVLPVLTVPDAAAAPDLARALLAGGIAVVEITLRTDAALAAIRRIAAEVPEVTVGAGTVTRADDLTAAREAGARFAVSPGLTPALAAAAARQELPFLPGVATASEAMAARDHGFTILKLFPAAAAGGRRLLQALAGPLPDLEFCPTGGIGPDDFRAWLELPNVLCVGGSWVAPASAISAHDWARIEELAREVTT
jgi:2-dehydro-3-deoxyphosphogluconate aldolase/(4S)-4-hydroxy-2-oxoglutarate aldolase